MKDRTCCIWKCDKTATNGQMTEIHTECPGGEMIWLWYCDKHYQQYVINKLSCGKFIGDKTSHGEIN